MAENDGDTPSRRKLMKLAATAAAAAPAGVVVGSAQGAGADAELIRLCSEYMEAVTAYDASGARLAPEDDPLWHAVEAIELRLDDLATGTLAGEAMERGVFGAPAFFVGEEMFWGNDRLHFVEKALGRG